MKTKRLTDALERVETWPEQAQDELADIVRDMDAGLRNVTYEPTPEELEGIDRGLRDAAQDKFATDQKVEAALAKFRRK